MCVPNTYRFQCERMLDGTTGKRPDHVRNILDMNSFRLCLNDILNSESFRWSKTFRETISMNWSPEKNGQKKFCRKIVNAKPKTDYFSTHTHTNTVILKITKTEQIELKTHQNAQSNEKLAKNLSCTESDATINNFFFCVVEMNDKNKSEPKKRG